MYSVPFDIPFSARGYDVFVVNITHKASVTKTAINYRFSDAHAFLKEAVNQGRFGRLINVNVATRWYRASKYHKDSPWYGTLALDSGSALMN